jgi:hypothetical protein
MPKQQETLDLLNQGKNYEEKLADDLMEYYLACLSTIEFTDKDREEIRRLLLIIHKDSVTHAFAFNDLINYVLKNGESNY